MRPGMDAIRAVPLFSGFGPDELHILNEVSDLARVGPDEVLFRQGERPRELTVLTAGFVAETAASRTGEAVIGVASPPAPLAFAAAMLGMPTGSGARSISSVRLIVVPAAPVHDLLKTRPALSLAFLDQALLAAQSLSEEIVQLKLCSAPRRLAAFLLELAADPDMQPARYVLPYEKRFLAGKVGCSQENLSRAFAALRPLGVETRRGVVVLRDTGALRAFVETGRLVAA
jgi:CRP/FNR family transcriptional activator FtrB